jgi:hypothetical protein
VVTPRKHIDGLNGKLSAKVKRKDVWGSKTLGK